MTEGDRKTLLVLSLRRLLWATKTDYVFLSLLDQRSKKHRDPELEVLSACESDSFELYPYSDSHVVYPNGVLHKDDYAKVGVWVTLVSMQEEPGGVVRVEMRYYATHLTTFTKAYRWKQSVDAEGDEWVQVGSAERVG